MWIILLLGYWVYCPPWFTEADLYRALWKELLSHWNKFFQLVHLISRVMLCLFLWRGLFGNRHFIFYFILFSSLLFYYFCFLRPHLRHMEVPRLGVESKLQLPAYTTATATSDPSPVCDLYRSSWQHCILNPLSEAMNCILTDTSRFVSAETKHWY